MSVARRPFGATARVPVATTVRLDADDLARIDAAFPRARRRRDVPTL